VARERYWTVGTSRDYATLHGVSLRTAQKRIGTAPGAFKSGRGWRVPILSTDYARIHNVSAKTARAKGVKAGSPTDLVVKALIRPPVTSRRVVPWTVVTPENMFGLGRLPNAQYQYQGLAVVRMKVSGAVITVYTHTIVSATPLTYDRLDKLIRDSIARIMGSTSPYTVLTTAVIRAKSTHTP
jgi:hypothetical protein